MSSNPQDPQQNPDDDFSKMFQEMFGQFFGSGEQGQMPPLPPGMTPEDMAKAFNPEMMGQIFSQVQAMFSGAASEGPVNWEQAKNTALQVAKQHDSTISEQHSAAVSQAFELADLWLNNVTEFESPAQLPQAWTCSEWVEHTMDSWAELTEPVAASVSEAMSESLQQQLPEEMAASLGPALPMLKNLGGMMFALQLGQAVGKLSGEVLGTSDIGLPIARPHIALMPTNIKSFADGLEVANEDVFIYLALRESAYQRLFLQVPWLYGELKSAIQQYASGFQIDTERMDEIAQHFDPMNPESFQQHIEGSFVRASDTPEQQAALARLETQLALIEGWVDDVVAEAATHLTSAEALRETMRRRRATGGPSELAFGALVGLELRPRRLRDAANLWAFIREQAGSAERDKVWSHPDMQPTTADLDDPTGFFERREQQAEKDQSFEDDLRKLLEGGYDEDPQSESEDPNKD
ncbi:zinc-dependent metalloprotease [Micrococcoides hystricis]|uniref:Zinc-dependent metalloprotease n=1 Tax=Micrococcoides hystricis TaxID=1572761 RepID=A0ABV6P953_9MICC